MDNLSDIFKALSDPSRLRILHLLFESGELCVCDIESTLSTTQTKVSRHLAYLRRVGLIQRRKKGLWMLYSVSNPGSPEHTAIMECVRKLILSNDVAKKDKNKLIANIKRGCCATFAEVKVGKVPASLQKT